MTYPESEYLMLSGIQHFAFCKRQWALIHLEQQWQENLYTQEGQILHENADQPFLKEKRKGYSISRSIPVSSSHLGLSGILDIVEFKKTENGNPIPKRKGLWEVQVVEYKRGKKKPDNRDEVQLAAQCMCLEEYWDIHLEQGQLYYFETRKRETVLLTDELRNTVQTMAQEMHRLYRERKTPKAEFYKNCTLCSLYSVCMPRLTKKKRSIEHYLFDEESTE